MNKTQTRHAAGILNDLLKINNECLVQSTTALSLTSEPEIRSLLVSTQKKIVIHSEVLQREISHIILHPADEDVCNGAVYQFWKELNAAITPQESRTVVAACEYHVDAARAAYQLAMSDASIPAFVHRVIEEQHQELQKVHAEVSAMLEEDIPHPA